MNNGVNNNQNNLTSMGINNSVSSVNQVPTSQTAQMVVGNNQASSSMAQPVVANQNIQQSSPNNVVNKPPISNDGGNIYGQQDFLSNANGNSTSKDGKPKIKLVPILIIFIIILLLLLFFLQKNFKNKIANLNYNCTPIGASEELEDMDINSTLINDLYSKVSTNIREDLAQPEFNDNMRLYLAYRQILEKDKYDSNCNLFNNLAMEPYTCETSTTFIPKAFKEETMTKAIKKMFGENTQIPFDNIRLGKSCIGGYQYIAARGEFVQGICRQQTATSYRVTKKLVKASSKKNTIILKEEVKYHQNEGMPLPASLKSGDYYYTFRLDMNYNYVLVNKTYENKY